MKNKTEKAYLGDAVFAEWNGYAVTLTTPFVAGAIIMEPEVLAALASKCADWGVPSTPADGVAGATSLMAHAPALLHALQVLRETTAELHAESCASVRHRGGEQRCTCGLELADDLARATIEEATGETN